MLQSFFGGTVQFELKNINTVLCLHYGIGTPTGAADFGFYKLPHQSENDIEDSLIMTLGIGTQVVGNTGKENFQTFHERIDITGTEFTHELGNVKTGLVVGDMGIIGNQKIQKAIADFVVGEA